MQHRRAITLGAVVAIVVSVFTLSPANAQAVNSVKVFRPITRCYTVLAKLAPGETASKILSQECVKGNQRAASVTGNSVAIMEFFPDADYRYDSDPFSGVIVGHDGPCDSAGYGMSNLLGHGFIGSIASSFKLYANCHWFQGFHETGYQNSGGWMLGDHPYIGDFLNDHVGSAKITS